MLARTLTAEGYDVRLAGDGGAALAAVERSLPDLLVPQDSLPPAGAVYLDAGGLEGIGGDGAAVARAALHALAQRAVSARAGAGPARLVALRFVLAFLITGHIARDAALLSREREQTRRRQLRRDISLWRRVLLGRVS